MNILKIIFVANLSFFLLFLLQDKIQAQSSFNMQAEHIENRLHRDVEKITSVRPFRNFKNIATLNAVADFIYNDLQKSTDRVQFQEFSINGTTYKNVIASFGPEDGPRIIVGAHYDVYGDQPGADDNASGVAGLLELARMLNHKPEMIESRVDLVAYSLEEPPFFATDDMGSAIHAKYLYDNQIPVKAMICLEMIGYFSEKPRSQGFPSDSLKAKYPDKGNFIIVVGKSGQETFTQTVKGLMQKYARLDVQSINLPAEEYLATLSDHRNYWKWGYDAVMINDTSFLRNPHYHKTSDTIETLDFKKMTEVVIGVYNVVLGLGD